MDNIKKSNAKKLDVTNAYEVDCPNCNRSFIIDCGEDKKPTYCPYCDYILGSIEIKFDRSFFYDTDLLMQIHQVFLLKIVHQVLLKIIQYHCQ